MGKEGVHPCDRFLQERTVPSIWCSGCGIGTVVNTFVQTIERLHIDPNEISVVAGIGCTGKIIDYLKLPSSHQSDGCALSAALSVQRRKSQHPVVVFLNDTDLMMARYASIRQASKSGFPFLILYINNYIYYTLVEHRKLTSTPFFGDAIASSQETPFDIPRLAAKCGASYIARWTPLHVRRLMYSMIDALQQPGLSIIEIISPCLLYYASTGVDGQSFDRMQYFQDNSNIKNSDTLEDTNIRASAQITIGKWHIEKAS